MQLATRAANPSPTSGAQWDVYFASVEMTPGELASRAVSMLAGIPTQDVTSPTQETIDRHRSAYGHAVTAFRDFALDFHAGRNTPAAIMGDVDRWFHRPTRDPKRPAVLFIDYLQILSIKQEKGQTRDRAIGEVTGALKRMATELGIAVVLLSQLNRQSEGRDSKRPRMSDLRESGNIEQDANNIIGMTRPFFGFDDGRKDEIIGAMKGDTTINFGMKEADAIFHRVQINILKQRGGGNVGAVFDSRFDGSRMTFTEETR